MPPARVPPFAPGILGAKGSIYVTRQTLFTHIATRETTQAMADDLFEAVTSGKVKIRIDQRYPLAQVQQAHRDLEARKTTGCTILTLVSLAAARRLACGDCAPRARPAAARPACRCGRATPRIGSVEPDFLRGAADAAPAWSNRRCAAASKAGKSTANSRRALAAGGRLPCARPGLAHAWRDEQLAVTRRGRPHARHRRTRRGAAARHRHLRRAPDRRFARRPALGAAARADQAERPRAVGHAGGRHGAGVAIRWRRRWSARPGKRPACA